MIYHVENFPKDHGKIFPAFGKVGMCVFFVLLNFILFTDLFQSIIFYIKILVNIDYTWIGNVHAQCIRHWPSELTNGIVKIVYSVELIATKLFCEHIGSLGPAWRGCCRRGRRNRSIGSVEVEGGGRTRKVIHLKSGSERNIPVLPELKISARLSFQPQGRHYSSGTQHGLGMRDLVTSLTCSTERC